MAGSDGGGGEAGSRRGGKGWLDPMEVGVRLVPVEEGKVGWIRGRWGGGGLVPVEEGEGWLDPMEMRLGGRLVPMEIGLGGGGVCMVPVEEGKVGWIRRRWEGLVLVEERKVGWIRWRWGGDWFR